MKVDKRTLWGSVTEAGKAAPAFFNLKVWRWLADMHSPFDVGPPTYAWCPTCRKPWPCTEWVDASDEVVALERHAAREVTE